MKYLDLINKVLVELNYKKVRSAEELVKNDHLKIKNILNVLNAEVCNFDNWNFLLRKTLYTLPKGFGEIDNSINGRIALLTIDGNKFDFSADFEKFLLNNAPSNTYSELGNKLLFPKFGSDKEIEIVYYTNNYALSEDGEEKPAMTAGGDMTVIPEPYVEPILIYGTCMRMKANPQYAKFNYWFGMYKDALATMRSKLSPNASQSPSIRLDCR